MGMECQRLLTMIICVHKIKMVQLNVSSGLLPSSSSPHHVMHHVRGVAENFDPDPPRPIEASWLEHDPACT